MNYEICNQDFKNCPYRVWDLSKDYPLCYFYRLHSRIIINREFSQLPSLVRKACEWVQKEEARLKCIRGIALKRTLRMLKKIEIGDTLFWTTHSEDVKLLEKPNEFSQVVRIKCQKSNGIIVEIPAHLLRKVSNGNYYGDFITKGINEEDLQELQYKARYYGFRVETEKKDNGYLLRIYGDTQQEVDEFIILALEQDFDISPFI